MPTPEQDRQMLDELRKLHEKAMAGECGKGMDELWINNTLIDSYEALHKHAPRLLELAAKALQTPPVTDESALRKRIKEVVAQWLTAERDGDRREHPADHELINDLCLLLSAAKPVTPEDAKRRARALLFQWHTTIDDSTDDKSVEARLEDLITQALLARGGGGEEKTK